MDAREKKGFTLIEMVVVTAIIAIIAAIAMSSLTEARKRANRAAAEATLQCFLKAALMYSQQTETQTYWANGTKDFGKWFSHKPVKAGYNFRYFSNSSNDSTDDATEFVYMAWPVSTSTGSLGGGRTREGVMEARVIWWWWWNRRRKESKCYYVDENAKMWFADAADWELRFMRYINRRWIWFNQPERYRNLPRIFIVYFRPL